MVKWHDFSQIEDLQACPNECGPLRRHPKHSWRTRAPHS